MKKIFTAILIGMGLMSTAFASDLYLEVHNASHAAIDVQEGTFLPKDQVLLPGEYVDWHMLTGSMDHVSIAYHAVTGEWIRIPGCPYGTYYHSIDVTVVPSYGYYPLQCV